MKPIIQKFAPMKHGTVRVLIMDKEGNQIAFEGKIEESDAANIVGLILAGPR